MVNEGVKAAIKKASEYIDALTVDSTVNVPEQVVADENRFFTWDNEKRSPATQPYLYDWSYYNGVVMEGLYDVWQADRRNGSRYLDYVRRYLNALLVTDESGHVSISRNLGGYVDCHGADCYKTASLLLRASVWDDRYMQVCRDLYRDLTDTSYVNSTGHIVPLEYTEEALGGNYWHSWNKDRHPKYKVWLDGIYMLQPFIARYAAMTGDTAQLDLVDKRLSWVAETALDESLLFRHACNSCDDYCPYFWTRAMGWYGMAMVDVMEFLPEKYIRDRKEALEMFAVGMTRNRKPEGMWTNLADRPTTETNRLEVSGTAMIAYTLLKGVRMGWLEKSFSEPAQEAFRAIVERKLVDGRLTDIYLRASANGSNNYENTSFYLPDEGKGVGPFIMAYSEMLYL